MNGFNNFNSFERNFNLISTIITIFGIIIFISVIGMFVIMLVPKFRSKFMGYHLKSKKIMMDDNKDVLRDIYNMDADIQSDSITKKTSAMAKGLSEEMIKVHRELLKENELKNTMFCRHCGAKIASDSKYCNICGKKL